MWFLRTVCSKVAMSWSTEFPRKLVYKQKRHSCSACRRINGICYLSSLQLPTWSLLCTGVCMSYWWRSRSMRLVIRSWRLTVQWNGWDLSSSSSSSTHPFSPESYLTHFAWAWKAWSLAAGYQWRLRCFWTKFEFRYSKEPSKQCIICHISFPLWLWWQSLCCCAVPMARFHC